MENNSQKELISKISKSIETLNKTEKIFENLFSEVKNQVKLNQLKEENIKLEISNKSSQEKIKALKEQINKLSQNININKDKIINLKQENDYLKKKNINKFEQKEKLKKNNLIHSIQDLKESLNFSLFNNKNEDEDESESIISINNVVNKEVKIIKEENEFEVKPVKDLDKKKNEYELIFGELKEKCNNFYEDIKQENGIIKNYKKCLNDINKKMYSFNEK